MSAGILFCALSMISCFFDASAGRVDCTGDQIVHIVISSVPNRDGASFYELCEPAGPPVVPAGAIMTCSEDQAVIGPDDPTLWPRAVCCCAPWQDGELVVESDGRPYAFGVAEPSIRLNLVAGDVVVTAVTGSRPLVVRRGGDPEIVRWWHEGIIGSTGGCQFNTGPPPAGLVFYSVDP